MSSILFGFSSLILFFFFMALFYYLFGLLFTLIGLYRKLPIFCSHEWKKSPFAHKAPRLAPTLYVCCKCNKEKWVDPVLTFLPKYIRERE